MEIYITNVDTRSQSIQYNELTLEVRRSHSNGSLKDVILLSLSVSPDLPSSAQSIIITSPVALDVNQVKDLVQMQVNGQLLDAILTPPYDLRWGTDSVNISTQIGEATTQFTLTNTSSSLIEAIKIK